MRAVLAAIFAAGLASCAAVPAEDKSAAHECEMALVVGAVTAGLTVNPLTVLSSARIPACATLTSDLVRYAVARAQARIAAMRAPKAP